MSASGVATGDGPLAGRVAVVTGVSRRKGIGFAVAERLGALGADLLVQGLSRYDESQSRGGAEDTDELAAELRERVRRVVSLEADFLDPRAPERVMARAAGALGHVDVLVANHAYSTRQPLDALEADEIDRHLLVNVRATLLLVRAFAAQHDGRSGGRVVLLTSGQHRGPMGAELAYAASKGALHQVTQSLSDVLMADGITVNSVNPGPTDTGWAGPEELAAARERMPLGRWGRPEDAARLIAWLATDEAAWITGQVLDSEGGFRR